MRNGVGFTLATLAVYATLFGAGTERREIFALGVALLALAVLSTIVWTILASVLRARRAWVWGEAHVVTASAPPPSAAHGRCDLQVILDVPGLPNIAVRLRDPRVPVAKWPTDGTTLPVLVAVHDPRRVRVRWDDAPTAAPSPADADDLVELDIEPPPELTPEELEALALGEAPPFGPRRVLPLEAEPSMLVARYLFPTERYRGEWKRHLVRPVREYAAVLAFAVLGTIAVRQRAEPEYVTKAVGALCVVGAVTAVHVGLSWYVGRFVLTNKRVLLVQGVLRRRVTSMPLPRVSDLRYQQSGCGRALNYGDFILERARWFSRLRRVADLPNPNELYLRLTEEIHEPEAVEARLSYS